MDGRITLITPPDIFENSNTSVLFVNLSEPDQDIVSRWLSANTITENLNFYVYSGEVSVPWFLHALSRCEHKYIDLNNSNYVINALSSYMLSKSGVYYKVDDENISSIYSHINTNKITRIETFLERLLIEQGYKPQL
jgi:hypothetical protein